jgi:hypothetical protein
MGGVDLGRSNEVVYPFAGTWCPSVGEYLPHLPQIPYPPSNPKLQPNPARPLVICNGWANPHGLQVQIRVIILDLCPTHTLPAGLTG